MNLEKEVRGGLLEVEGGGEGVLKAEVGGGGDLKAESGGGGVLKEESWGGGLLNLAEAGTDGFENLNLVPW